MDGPTCTSQTQLPPSGRKAKSKAPRPPSETKITEFSSFESELTNFTMEQQENVTDRDIELSVILPGDVIKSTTVNGSKPMMDLLVYLCAQYRLNPSSHVIDVMSAEKKQIKFKPNTPIGMLEVERVILKPKQMDKKKPAPIIPEQTVRVVINYKKTQKTVVRVSPHAPLEDLIDVICSKCDFDPLHTLLLKSYQSQETLDMTKSLNELGLRELYAMNVSGATPAAEFSLSSLRDSCQNSQNLEKENKGFLSFFQRSKKKREQTASAPATPLMNKPRPAFIIRSNTVSKQYDSNTLPSEMPKKRRAPLPPMPASQSVPQDLAQTQDRPYVMKSSSVDETDKGLSGVGITRTGSLHLSGTSSVNSSLRRAKRKAPSPPPRKHRSDNSVETGSETAESIHPGSTAKGRNTEVLSPTGNVVDLTRTTPASCCSENTNQDQNNIQQVSDETNHLGSPDTPDESEVSLKSDIGSEFSLEEIDEKEEMHEENSGTTLSTSTSTSNAPLEMQENETTSLAHDPTIDTVDNVKDSNGSNEENPENKSADDKLQESNIVTGKIALNDSKPPGELQRNNDHTDAKVLQLTTQERRIDAEGRENKVLEAESLSNCKVYHIDICLSPKHSFQEDPGVSDQKLDQSNLEPLKTQDVAIQATPPDNSFDQSTISKNTQDCKLIVHKDVDSKHESIGKNQPSKFLNRVYETVGVMTEFHEMHQAVQDGENLSSNLNNTCANDSHVTSQRIVTSPVSSPTRGYPLYRQDSKPKPKPSNEITREYIPKVGMTTYKIVPPKSLEILKNWDSDAIENREATSLNISPSNENSQELGTQTEIFNISERSNQTGPDLTHEVTSPGNIALHNSNSSVDNTMVSQSNITSKKAEAEYTNPNPGHVTAPLVLSGENKSYSTPAVQAKSNILSPPAKPSNFYLQMQRRASSHYVTSAIARTGSGSSPTQGEAKSIETEKKLASPDKTSFPFPRTASVPLQLIEQKIGNGDGEKKMEVATSPPVKMPKPLKNYLPSQPDSVSSPIQVEATSTEIEKQVASSDINSSPFPRTACVPPQSVEKKMENGHSEKKMDIITYPPVKMPKPLDTLSFHPGSLSGLTQSEAKSIEMEKQLASPDKTSFPFPRTANVPLPSVEKKTENGHSEKKMEVLTSLPVKMPKPLPCQPVSLSSPTQSEAKSAETEKQLASPDKTSFPFPRTANVPLPSVEKKTENGHSEKKMEVPPSPPVKMPKPLNSLPSKPPSFNPKTLRTFVLPQPYSNSRPSPFALAVSSAVRRSQSFSKTCTSANRPLKEQSSLDLSSSVSNNEIKSHSLFQTPAGESQHSMTDKKSNCSTSEQNRKVTSLSGHSTTPVCERGNAVGLQRPDPEQIHQSLLAAIRSGEAAAKLRRVGPPPNTVAINGRSTFSSTMSVETRYNNH